jgi:hypothetical protein
MRSFSGVLCGFPFTPVTSFTSGDLIAGGKAALLMGF